MIGAEDQPMPYDIGNLRDLDRLLPATCTTRPDIARSHLAAIFADHDLRLSAGSVDFTSSEKAMMRSSSKWECFYPLA